VIATAIFRAGACRHFWLVVASAAAVVTAAAGVATAHAQAVQGPLALDDVLREALRLSPNVLLQQQQVIGSEGAVLQAQGQFDTVFNAGGGRQQGVRPLRADEIATLQGAGIFGVDRQSTFTSSWNSGVNKNLINGITVGGSMSVASINDSAQAINGIPTQTTGTLLFTAKVPLMKNLGRETTGAALFAAENDYNAAQFDLAHTNAQTLLNVVIAYWSYLGAQRSLEIAAASEQRARALIDDINTLIKADQLPRAEIELLLANRAEKTTLRLQAEQSLLQARQTLGRAVGLPADRSLALALPREDFPHYTGGDSGALLDRFSAQALRSRADVEANRLREAAARYRVDAARNNLKPQIDLNLNLGYSTLLEGRGPFDGQQLLYQNRVGPVAGASISAQWPQGNSTARGNLLTQSSAYTSSTILLHELEASVVNSVSVQYEALRRAAAQLAEAEEGVRRYAIALNNEQTKRRLGLSTLIDVINVQDRLEAARLLQVQVQAAYANAITQFRFVIGALVQKTGDAFTVRTADLLSGDVRPE
jgi:outer membrane protein TolC